MIIILIIGGVILVVLNIFNVRERKYEVAAQFMCEILVVTMVAIVVGAGIGAVSSVPITNALIENQINSENDMNDSLYYTIISESAVATENCSTMISK